jgi:hypothetical protein
MTTDHNNSKRGFMLRYSTNCNRTIEKDFGVIESPGYPESYPQNLDCSWKIVVNKGNKINLQFSQFRLINKNQIHNETKVRKGENVTSHLMSSSFRNIFAKETSWKSTRWTKIKSWGRRSNTATERQNLD